MDSLRKALVGNYAVILSLLGLLENGFSTKRLVDRVIDSCKDVLVPESTNINVKK